MIKKIPAIFRPSPTEFLTKDRASDYVVMYFGDPIGSGNRGYVVGRIDRVKGTDWKKASPCFPEQYHYFSKGKEFAGTVASALILDFSNEFSGESLVEIGIRFYYKVNLSQLSAEIVYSDSISEPEIYDLVEQLKSVKVCNTPTGSPSNPNNKMNGSFTHELSLAEYKKKFDLIKEDIRSGRYYEINFTHQVRGRSKRDPWSVYCGMEKRLEARYAAWIPLEDRTIVSGSPELFFSLQDGRIQTAPIKGSVLSNNPTANDITEKLKSEHIMVVDLARNDIGKISRYGTVKPNPMLAWEKFGKLHHLVSVIHGGIKTDSIEEIFDAMHPAASITGTPKIEVLKAIKEYEAEDRGIYTGSLGWMDIEGLTTFNVAIRTVEARDINDGEFAYSFGVGGAVVDDSDAEEEYLECIAKAEPLIDILTASE